MNDPLSNYIILVDFLSKILGKNTEIALQSVSKHNSGIIYIVNNHISGRKIGDPLTELALKWLKEKTYLYKNYEVGYLGKTKNNNKIYSSTFFIKEQNELKGFMCFNTDTVVYKHFLHNLLNTINIPFNSIFDDIKLDNDNFIDTLSEDLPSDNLLIEDFSLSIEDQIKNILAQHNLTFPLKKLKPQERKNLILEFDKQHFFMIKGSVHKLSEMINVSIPTIYRYLSEKNK